MRALRINEEMQIAATPALRDLARERVPSDVVDADGVDTLSFRPNYIIHKPFDPRSRDRQ